MGGVRGACAWAVCGRWGARSCNGGFGNGLLLSDACLKPSAHPAILLLYSVANLAAGFGSASDTSTKKKPIRFCWPFLLGHQKCLQAPLTTCGGWGGEGAHASPWESLGTCTGLAPGQTPRWRLRALLGPSPWLREKPSSAPDSVRAPPLIPPATRSGSPGTCFGCAFILGPRKVHLSAPDNVCGPVSLPFNKMLDTPGFIYTRQALTMAQTCL